MNKTFACFLGLLSACATARPAPDPMLVELEAAAENRFVAAGAPQDLLVRIRVRGGETGAVARAPLDLALVIDASGSMEGAAIDAARKAALAVIDAMADGDRLSIVAFHSTTEVLLKSVIINAQSRQAARDKIATLKAHGTTDLAGGLAAGVTELENELDRDHLTRMLLLSDGLPNDAAPFAAILQRAKNLGVGITCFGLGLEYDESLLGHIAQQTGGGFQFIEDPATTAVAFHEHVLKLDRLAARRLRLELVLGPGVAVKQIVGHNDAVSGGRSLALDLPDLDEGGIRDVIVKLAVSAHREGANVELFDARLQFEDAAGNTRRERNTFLAAQATKDEAKLAEGRSTDVDLSAARSMAAAAVIESLAMARAGRLGDGQLLLDQNIAAASGAAEKHNSASLREQIKEMNQVRAALPGVADEAKRQQAQIDLEEDANNRKNVRKAHSNSQQALY